MTMNHLAATVAAAVGLAFASTASGADHAEAPLAAADIAADLADLYVWHSDTHLTVVVTYAGLQNPADPAVYDDAAVYAVHIDRDGDGVSDRDILARFGEDSQGNWGLRVDNLPGTGAPVIGAVEQVIDAPGGRVWAGLRDDPFFFDLEGYTNTLATGTIDFSADRDSVAGLNVSAIVLEMDLGSALEGASDIQVWSTTGRI